MKPLAWTEMNDEQRASAIDQLRVEGGLRATEIEVALNTELMVRECPYRFRVEITIASPGVDAEPLSKDELFLLGWLASEDVSRLGECHGRVLDSLVQRGLAKILPPPPNKHPHFGGVMLTADGILAAKMNTGTQGSTPQ